MRFTRITCRNENGMVAIHHLDSDVAQEALERRGSAMGTVMAVVATMGAALPRAIGMHGLRLLQLAKSFLCFRPQISSFRFRLKQSAATRQADGKKLHAFRAIDALFREAGRITKGCGSSKELLSLLDDEANRCGRIARRERPQLSWRWQLL